MQLFIGNGTVHYNYGRGFTFIVSLVAIVNITIMVHQISLIQGYKKEAKFKLKNKVRRLKRRILQKVHDRVAQMY